MDYESCHQHNFSKSASLPDINNGIVCAAKFETCKQNKLILKVVKIINAELENGILKNAWWVITTKGLPDRFVNMYNGKKSLERFLLNYGFSDISGCVHYNKGKIYTVDSIQKIKQYHLNIPKDVTDIIGIPQRLANSGICWYAATCFAFFYCKQLRELITRKMNDGKLIEYCNNCLKNAAISEKLREKLWYEYSFGDKIGQPPELDGQNGLSQFCILASKLNIPMKRYFVNNGKIVKLKDPVKDQQQNICHVRDKLYNENEPHILIIRFYRGDNHSRFKPMRRFNHNGKRYKLASMLLGSMHCGHQIGASSYNLEWNRWAISDSDSNMFGIGPIHFCSDTRDSRSKQIWWSYWRYMIPLTVFGQQQSFCDLSPHNRPTGEFENVPKAADVGDLNLDLIYLSI